LTCPFHIRCSTSDTLLSMRRNGTPLAACRSPGTARSDRDRKVHTPRAARPAEAHGLARSSWKRLRMPLARVQALPYPRGVQPARGVPLVVALVIVSCVAMVAVAGGAFMGMWLARRASDETRAQMHASLVDERAVWLEQAKAWQEERKLLLDRLSDREGRVAAVFQGPKLVETTPTERKAVEWDEDLRPFNFAEVEGGEGGAG